MLTVLPSMVIGMVCSILANLGTPLVQLTLSNYALAQSRRRLRILEQALYDTRLFRDDAVDLHTYLLGQMFVALCVFWISLFFLIAAVVYYPIIERYYVLFIVCLGASQLWCRASLLDHGFGQLRTALSHVRAADPCGD